MNKYIYCPFWRVDELEFKLSESEQNGFRLTNIPFHCKFTFAESKPKQTIYAVTYTMAQDNSPGMYSFDSWLLSECNANKIPTKFSGYSVYRITRTDIDLCELKRQRNLYFKRVVFQYLLIALFFLLVALFLVVGTCLTAKTNTFSKVLSIIFALVSFILTGYLIHGYSVLSRKVKEWHR